MAGRLVGAFRNIGRNKIADTIIDTMRSAGYTVNETDPFEDKPAFIFSTLSKSETSPHVNRLRMMWESFRKPIAENFPASPRKISNTDDDMKQIDGVADLMVDVRNSYQESLTKEKLFQWHESYQEGSKEKWISVYDGLMKNQCRLYPALLENGKFILRLHLRRKSQKR